MNKEKKIIPELRFSEFKDSEEWIVKPIENILEYERPDKYIVSNTDYKSFGVPVLTANKSFVLGYTEENIGICSNLPAIIFDDFTVDSKFVDFPFKVKSSAIKILRPKNNDNLKFIHEQISQIKFNATEHKRYYISEFQKINIPITSLKEQQKIASCLSSLDDLINAESEKLDLLKKHKKGLLQNLFPQDGETVPKYRFPEFKNDSEWAEKKICEIGNFIGGGTPDTSNENYWNGDILWYTPSEIKDGKLSSSLRKITELGLKNSSAKLLPTGTILITTRATIGDVAISDEICSTNQGFQSLIVNKDQVNLFWFYWIIKHKEELIKRSSGSTFKEISKNELKQINSLSPKKLEQQKIANCLSEIDKLIFESINRIECLKSHKKGLIQKLFPKYLD